MTFDEFYQGCNYKEKAYIRLAHRHTDKNDMKKFIKAVRREFDKDGIEYNELYQSMTVIKDDLAFMYSKDNDYFIGLNSYKGLDTMSPTGVLA